ncbi:MAG: hypothetical protein ACJAWL_003612 [Motiliproteus sp.]|jgi:hypothetical protein
MLFGQNSRRSGGDCEVALKIEWRYSIEAGTFRKLIYPHLSVAINAIQPPGRLNARIPAHYCLLENRANLVETTILVPLAGASASARSLADIFITSNCT